MTEFGEGVPEANPNAWIIAAICGILALILGMFGIIACYALGPFALLAGGIGVVFGYLAVTTPSQDSTSQIMAIVGLVLSTLGLILGLIGTGVLLVSCGFLSMYCGCLGCAALSNA